MQWSVGDRVRVAVEWDGNTSGAALRVQGKVGTVVEILDRESYPVVVDLDDSIVGRAAFRESELKTEN